MSDESKGYTEPGRDAEIEATEHLQAAVRALFESDHREFSDRIGRATQVVNEAAGVPYSLHTAGGLPVVAYGPGMRLPRGHSAWVTLPGKPTDWTPEHDFALNLYDHLHVYVEGEHKGEPTVTIQSDEFPTKIRIDDAENSFTEVEVVERDSDV